MKEIILAAACVVGAVLIWDRTRRFGLAVAWQGPMLVLVLTVPMALTFPLRSLQLDVRMVLYLVVVALLLVRPPTFMTRLRPVPADVALLLLIASLAASEFSNRTITPFGLALVILSWLPGYTLGRLFLYESRDLRTFMGPVCGAGVAWSFLSLAEGLSRYNLWHKLLGIEMDYDIIEIRMGMQRAFGPQDHPISWGVTLALLLPLMIEAAKLANRGAGQRWWAAAPWLMIPGYIACGSRAVQLMAGLSALGYVYYLAPRARAWIVAAGVAATLAFFVFRDQTVELIGSFVDDNEKPEMIVIHGEYHEYTGTKHRDLLYKVYEKAMDDAGWLGYGNPLQNVPLDEYVDARFISVDNHFLHIFLHNGALGLIFFCIFMACVLGNLAVVLVRGGPEHSLALTITGVMIGMLITFRTVWLDVNYSWFFLLLCGISGTLTNATLNPRAAGPYHQPHVES